MKNIIERVKKFALMFIACFGFAAFAADVAKVGDVTYADLGEALTAAKTAGTTCELLSDVDLTGKTWTPVTEFKGTFDGKDFKITGLTVTGTGNLGLFGSTSGATIKNVTIDGATIGTVADTTESNVGVLVGAAGTSTITGVTIKNATIASNAKYVGAIAGNSSSTITSCQVLGTADAVVTVKGKDQVGGISGYQWCNGVNNCTVSYCAVTALEERAGCLTGKLQCSSGNDSYFSVNGNTITQSSATAPDYAGGLVGQIHGDTDKYEIKNNKIDAVLTAEETNPIGVLRPFDQGAIATTFTAELAANVTGNWWENGTLAANSFQYTNVGDGVAAQTITRSREACVIEVTPATAQDAIDNAQEGDTIVLTAGSYEKLYLRQTLANSTRRTELDNGGSYPAYYRQFKNLTIKVADGAAVTCKGIVVEAGLFWHSSAPASNQAGMGRATSGFLSYLELDNIVIDGIAFDTTDGNSCVTLRDNAASTDYCDILVDGFTIQNCSATGDVTNKSLHFFSAGSGTNGKCFPDTEKTALNNIAIKNCSMTNFYQPICHNNATATVTGYTITGNTFTGCYDNQIQMSNGKACGAWVISNNTISGMTGRFVRLTNAAADATFTVENNTVTAPLQYDTGNDGSIFKVTGTAGFSVSETGNSWNVGAFNDDNTTYVAQGDVSLLPVAQIGETKYSSLKDALAAAKDNDTIKMIANETMADGVSLTLANKKVTLDLNGCTVTGSGNAQGQYFYFLSLGTGADLTIDDTSDGANGAIVFTANPYDSGYGVENCTIYNCGGTLTLKNGTVKNMTAGGLSYAINNSSNAWADPIVSTFTMLGGKVSAPKGDGALRIYQNAYSQVSENYVTISGGEIVDTGIFVDTVSDKDHDNSNTKTVVKITGGTINGLIDLKLRNDKVDFSITGGTFAETALRVRQADGSVVSKLTTPVVKISGGSFSFVAGKAFGLAYEYGTSSWDEGSVPYAVSGGLFNVDPTTYVAAGYAVCENTDSATSASYPYAIGQSDFYADADGVYHIRNLAGLVEFRTQTNAGTLKGKNEEGGHLQVVLDSDINLNNEEWTPINMSCIDFDGQNHTVKNLKVTGNAKNVGFFGEASISTVKNLTIDTATVEGINHVAAIAGDGLCGHFINCTVKNATITTKVYNNDDGDKAGAICGYLSGESDAEVTNCTVENCTITGYRDCGGAVGYANGTASVTGTTVKDTTVVNEKSVNYKTYATDAAYNVNQVVGNTTSKATVENNTATNVTVVRPTMVAKIGINEYDDLSAAIAAANGKEVTVELLCDVDLKGAAWTAATMNHATFDGKGHKVSNFTVTGEKMVGFFGNADCSTIKNLTIENATVNGINHVGAVAGRGMCTYIENCSAVNCTVTTTVKDNDDGDKAGAICGYLSGEPNAWVKGCTVTGCTVTGYRDTGAVVGYADCYASGTAEVSGCTVTDTTVINNRTVNYKNYQTDAEFDVNEVVGEICANAKSTFKDNTTTDVTVRRTVAKIGETVYFDLHEAFAAAKANETVELLCNVDLNGATWEPVNLVSYVTVDGKGYTVSNFTATGEKNVGLFGSASICTIKNLTVRNATVSGINHVAAIAGDGLCAKIENCSVFDSTITTTVKDNDDGDKAGAICGYLSGESTAWVKNCTVEGCTVTGYRDTGAVVGYANGTALVSGVTVTNSVVLCDQSVNYKSYSGDQFDVRAFIGEVVSTATTNSLKATTVSVGVVTDGFMPTTNGVWHITNLNGLKAFRDSVNSGKSYAGMTIQLDADIDLGNEDWTPIVAQNESVVFNGNGKTISNLKVVDEDGKDLGLFSNACGWTVKNLTIDGATVTGIGRVAALVGHGICAKIENCTVKNATVTANVADNDDGDKAGAISGYLTAQPNAWVKNCAVENCTIRGYRDIGGAVGYAQGNNCQVTGTTVTGTTVINDQMVNYKNYSGTEFDANLIVGQIDGTVSTEGSTATETVVTVIKPVAQIGDTKYASLKDAIAAAQNGDTITMLTDVDFGDYGATALTIPADKTVTIDLAGKQISGNTTSTECSQLILNKGSLTIKDSVGNGRILSGATTTWTYNDDYNYQGSYASNTIRNEGNITLESGAIENAATGYACYAIDNYGAGNVTVTGGSLYSAFASTIRMFYSTGDLTISGGSIWSKSRAAAQVMGGKVDVNISGGSLKTTTTTAGWGSLATYESPETTFTITGGNFTGALTVEAVVAISGGTFDADPNASYIVKGYQSKKSADSETWTVGEKDTVISNVKAAQRYPWNGKVDITFQLKTKSAVTLFVAAYDSDNNRIAMTAAKLVTKDANNQTVETDINVANGTFTGAANTEATTYHIVWDSTTVLPNAKKDGITFKVFAK